MIRPALFVAGGLIEICLLGMVVLGDLGRNIPMFLGLYGLAFITYLWAVRHADCFAVRSVVAFGLLFRLTLLPAEPSLSDDVYRYVWDGRVQAAGINPYRHAPDSPELEHLRDERLHPRINHPHIPTIYPPAAQFLFLACSFVASSVWCFKVVFVLIDLLAAWFVWRVLRQRGVPPGGLLVYMWSPLLVIETAGSGHMDVVGLALLSCGLAAVTSRRAPVAVSALAGACLAKLMPVAFLPAWWAWASRGNLTVDERQGIARRACKGPMAAGSVCGSGPGGLCAVLGCRLIGVHGSGDVCSTMGVQRAGLRCVALDRHQRADGPLLVRGRAFRCRAEGGVQPPRSSASRLRRGGRVPLADADPPPLVRRVVASLPGGIPLLALVGSYGTRRSVLHGAVRLFPVRGLAGALVGAPNRIGRIRPRLGVDQVQRQPAARFRCRGLRRRAPDGLKTVGRPVSR